MRIGLDLDNTLVAYDGLFVRVARDLKLPVANATGKSEVRAALRARAGGELLWRRLQAQVYGPRMREAPAYAGALEFVTTCLAEGHELFVVSHKTRLAAADDSVDLHQAALGWLNARGFGELERSGRVFFEATRRAKLERIEQLRLDCFVDDLAEVLDDPSFPVGTNRYWFSPWSSQRAPANARRVASFAELRRAWIG